MGRGGRGPEGGGTVGPVWRRFEELRPMLKNVLARLRGRGRSLDFRLLSSLLSFC